MTDISSGSRLYLIARYCESNFKPSGSNITKFVADDHAHDDDRHNIHSDQKSITDKAMRRNIPGIMSVEN